MSLTLKDSKLGSSVGHHLFEGGLFFLLLLFCDYSPGSKSRSESQSGISQLYRINNRKKNKKKTDDLTLLTFRGKKTGNLKH